MADEATTGDSSAETPLTFKVKTSSEGSHSMTMPPSATVLELKTKLAGADLENIPVERQRLIYSGRVMKNEEPLGTYKIKAGNTVHMVKSAASNANQGGAAGVARATGAGGAGGGSTGAAAAAAGIPQNMAAGTANNPLAGLTGARFAGHMGLPGREMFGADGGMGAPPSDEQMADMLSDPNTQQMMSEALQNPQMIDLMIQSNPMLRNMGPQAREMLQSPMFRQMMTDPATIRQAANMRRMMGGGAGGGGGGGAGGGFPAPGVTDTTPEGAAGTATGGASDNNSHSNAQVGGQQQLPFNPFGAGMPGQGMASAGNPFASLFGPAGLGAGGSFGPGAGTTPAQSPPPAPGSAGQATPSAAGSAAAAAANNPFASLFGGAAAAGRLPGAGAGGMPQLTPEMMQQAMAMLGGAGGAGGGGDMANPFAGMFGAGGAAAPAAPADTRPPEERYADQLRQLNDMGFFDFERNVEALRRAGGSVQGAIEQLLS